MEEKTETKKLPFIGSHSADYYKRAIADPKTTFVELPFSKGFNDIRLQVIDILLRKTGCHFKR